MNFVSIDLETTGFSQKYDTILQIAAVKVIDDKVVGEFNMYVHTTKRVPQAVVEITGITNELLNREGKPYSVVLSDFLNFVGNMDIVAHNASFDLRFLKQKILVKLGIDFSNNYFCTYQASKKKYPSLPNHKLDTVANHLGIPNIKHHDALNDARVCADITLSFGGKEIVATKSKSKIVNLLNNMRLTNKNNRYKF